MLWRLWKGLFCYENMGEFGWFHGSRFWEYHGGSNLLGSKVEATAATRSMGFDGIWWDLMGFNGKINYNMAFNRYIPPGKPISCPFGKNRIGPVTGKNHLSSLRGLLHPSSNQPINGNLGHLWTRCSSSSPGSSLPRLYFYVNPLIASW